ncbi:MAG: SAF domain-containing protein [Erysipelotrichaceae bacterium]|nr:SAF domain-containing protein [Erysipelotrichaceae bacterium]
MKKILSVCLMLLVVALLGYGYVMLLKMNLIKMVKIPIAKKTIAPRSLITEEDIDYIEVVQGYQVEQVMLHKEDLLGKYTDIHTTIPEGSMFYASSLFDIKQLPDYPSLLLKENQVAFSLPVDLNKLNGNTIVEGQYVDIYVSLPVKHEQPIFDKVLSHVRIISIKDRKGLTLDDTRSNGVPHICVLAISQEAVKVLSNASKVGEIELYVSFDSYEVKEESILHNESKVLEYLNNV